MKLTLLQYEQREKGYGRALLQAYHFAFTAHLNEMKLSHELLQGIHKVAMSHLTLKQPPGQYKNSGNFFPICIKKSKKTINPSGTVQGFFELVDKWLVNQKKSIHMINFKSDISNQIEYILHAVDGVLVWQAFLNRPIYTT